MSRTLSRPTLSSLPWDVQFNILVQVAPLPKPENPHNLLAASYAYYGVFRPARFRILDRARVIWERTILSLLRRGTGPAKQRLKKLLHEMNDWDDWIESWNLWERSRDREGWLSLRRRSESESPRRGTRPVDIPLTPVRRRPQEVDYEYTRGGGAVTPQSFSGRGGCTWEEWVMETMELDS